MSSSIKLEQWGRARVVWVRSDCIDQCVSMIEMGEADSVGISPYSGFDGTDINFLRSIKELKGVVLVYAEKFTFEALEELPRLKYLTIAGGNACLDISLFQELKELRLDWSDKFTLPPAMNFLESLYLRGYAPKTRDLSVLPDCPKLVALELVLGNMVSLAGINRFSTLKNLSLSYMKQLQDISCLSGLELERIEFDACKKINDVSLISACSTLKVIKYLNCGTIPSLNFINSCNALEEFRLGKTIVGDGDVSPLLRLPHVSFSDHKGYSHRSSDFHQDVGGAPSVVRT